ncbi:hypothetical protein [Saccharothrix sp. ST-888]|uniref:hypothetical protein n=1 Tax=Saccharothrix sp. ST-888 TaxID=1427391 RepID=UPI0005EC82FE|nr:hypothetical protein [Saccharothrix sp. ST-888]KJK57778.1 hypothetical protein UK12_14620 [Saccharothrix sp. ST-888]
MGQASEPSGQFGQAVPYRMTVTTPRPYQETVALADQQLAAWLKEEGCEEPPPRAEAPWTAGPPPPATERLRLGERILLDRDFGPLRAASVRTGRATAAARADRAPSAVLPAQAGSPGGGPSEPSDEPPEESRVIGHYTRRRLRTPAPHGTHQLTLTIATTTPFTSAASSTPATQATSSTTASGAPGAGPQTWVRLEAEHLASGPGVRTVGRVPVPELARTLLPLLDATDGPAAVGPTARLITPSGVDTLIDELCDPERRLPTIVASTPSGVPLDDWLSGTVEPLLRQLTGLAVLYVLDQAALPLFNVALEYHKVYGGAVRTYLPEVDPASRLDGSRHPVLARQRIEEDIRRAAALLAREPRRVAAELPPAPLLLAVPQLQIPAEVKRAARPEPSLPAQQSHLAAPSPRSQPAAPPHPLRQAPQKQQGHRPEPHADLAAGAEAAAHHCAEELQLQVFGRSLHAFRSRERWGESEEQYGGFRRTMVQVRSVVTGGRLCTVTAPEPLDHLPGARPAVDPYPDPTPATFGELVCRFGEFPLVEFTGDQKEALALDGRSDGTGWARLAWDGLTALQEYAAAAVRGEAHGDFKQWCEHTPPGCHHFPPRKAVRGESRTVESHTKWKRERMLPVPECVDVSRRAFMGAHLRIGGGRTAPRLHYLDDCSGSGRIYVGYIGLHLTNTRTN